jgi:hypothetical protein
MVGAWPLALIYVAGALITFGGKWDEMKWYPDAGRAWIAGA